MKIGFLADTHSMKADGSDLPDAVLKAFKGCDRIVHLGDIGRKAILDRLAEVAPVWIQSEDRKGYVPMKKPASPPEKVVADGGATCGLVMNLANPDKKIKVAHDSSLTFDDAMEKLLQKRFKADVQVVAFGGTHAPYNTAHDGVLFVNPGSPTMPMDFCKATVAVLELGAKPKAKIVEIR
jgi:putative phosphoesterase